MKAKEITDLTTQEIEARIVDEKDKLHRLRLKHAVSAIESPSDIRDSRRTLARLSTILRERQTAEQDNQ